MQKTTLYSFSEQRLKQYGYHVLEKRAIPDYRDGLKPVQRHILWSMYKLGMHNDKPYHKAARVVGETISKYHPHGDACCRKGTLIPLVNGKVKRIEDLVNTGKKKYRVWAYNEKTEKVVTAEAYNFREGQTTDIMYRITINEEFTSECTGNHPFMLRCGVWKRADELKVGNYLLGGKQLTNKSLYTNHYRRNGKRDRTKGITIEKEIASLKPEQYEQNPIIQFRFKRFRRIYPVFGADNFNLICLITNVECIQLDKPEVFYDFSVEEYQNMFVIPNNPRGDVCNYVLLHNSVYQSMVNMAGAINPDAQSSKDVWNNTNTNVPLIEGMGNWGTLLDAAASYKYTECKLSKYADRYLLDSDYINAVPFIKNFDGKETLPLYLPSKVPNLLINGSAAIAFGVSIDCPSFSFQSVLKTAKMVIEGEDDINVCKNLKLKPKVGGKCVSKFDDYFSLFESGEAKVLFEPEFIVDKNVIIFTSLCPSLASETSLVMLMDKLSGLPFVKSIYNTSSKSFSYEIELTDPSKENIEKVVGLSRRSQKYDFGVTITKIDHTQFKKLGIFNYLKGWCNWRTRIESLVLRQLIEVEENKIFKLQTVLLAHKNFDVIVKCLNSDNVKINLMKTLKINEDQATEILNMRLNSLSKVSISKIQQLKSECNRQIARLKDINPIDRIVSDWK